MSSPSDTRLTLGVRDILPIAGGAVVAGIVLIVISVIGLTLAYGLAEQSALPGGQWFIYLILFVPLIIALGLGALFLRHDSTRSFGIGLTVGLGLQLMLAVIGLSIT